MGEHRVSMLASSLRRAEDPESSTDPRVRTLVEALKTADYAPAPDPRFRAELRAQLVAVAPRIIAEGTPQAEAAPTHRRRSAVVSGRPRSDQVRRHRFVRPVAIASGVAAAFLLLFGGAVWMSQKSLPGDSLYGLKRASENVQLSLSSGGTDRGHEYLSLAQTRVEEAQALLRRDSASASGSGTLAGSLSSHTTDLIAGNLTSADSDLRHGTDLLNTQAVAAASQSPLAVITGWAPGQLVRLHDLATALPGGSLQNRVTSSWTLTSSALTRARTLEPDLTTGCASTLKTDRLGPVPTCGAAGGGTTSATPATPATPAPRAPASSGTATAGRPGPNGTTTGSRATTHDPPAGTPAAPTPAATTAPLLPTLLPSTAPVSVGSCGVSIGLGPIGIGVGGCPSHS